MSQPEPEATPEQQEAVRRLLAEARHTDPVPSDVADRLDRVLAQLATTEGPRVDTTSPGPVVDLAARRRRTRATQLLAAAAAVVVLGVGIGQVVDDDGGSGDVDAASTADPVDRAPAGSAAEVAPSDDNDDNDNDGGGAVAPTPSEVAPDDDRPTAVVPLIDSADFTATVLGLREADAVTSTSAVTPLTAADLTSDAMFVCPATVLGEGRLVPVSYAGRPSVLAYRAPTGATQTVELLQCGTGDVVRSVVIPVP